MLAGRRSLAAYLGESAGAYVDRLATFDLPRGWSVDHRRKTRPHNVPYSLLKYASADVGLGGGVVPQRLLFAGEPRPLLPRHVRHMRRPGVQRSGRPQA